MKNLVFANRLTQHAVKLSKDICSDRDILEEESIKPSKSQSKTLDLSDGSMMEDEPTTRRPEQATASQLIRYKQQIHFEKDRRIHRQELAAIAKAKREKESFIYSDLAARPEEILRQNFDHADTSAQVGPGKHRNDASTVQKSTTASKEEEDILNEENLFQPRRQRDRTRTKKKPFSVHAHALQMHRQSLPVMSKSVGTIVCKVCGNKVDGSDQQPMPHLQLPFSELSISRHHHFIVLVSLAAASLPQPASQSVETTSNTIDDWFESSSSPSPNVSLSADDLGRPPTGSSTFRRSLFQPINDPVEHRPPIRSVMSPNNDENKTQHLTTSRLSESGMFARSPEPKLVRPSLTTPNKTSANGQ